MDGVLSSRTPSALMSALGQRGYQFGMFASDGFSSPLYRQALLSDFSLPTVKNQSNAETTLQWMNWLNGHNNGTAPWFSYLSLTTSAASSERLLSNERHYQRAAADVDQQIHNVLNTLEQKGLLANTVVVITAQHGVVLDDNSHDGNRAMLQVPLVVHWPSTPAQTVNKLTVHQDIMTTLMQRLLQVNTPASDYSQGEDLFAAQRRHNWVTGRTPINC